jgi:methionine synthase II (cobalamin-independent)
MPPGIKIPTEPIGSIPRPLRLIEAVAARDGTDPVLDPLYDEAIRDASERFEATGSPVIADGGPPPKSATVADINLRSKSLGLLVLH